jgi:hypothetical protein
MLAVPTWHGRPARRQDGCWISRTRPFDSDPDRLEADAEFRRSQTNPMSQGSGTGSNISEMTGRGRDYPTIRQFTVFIENRVGQLLEVLRRFRGTKIRIVALNILDSTECSIVRFVLTNPEQGREVFERAGLAMIESNLIALELPDDPQPLALVCNALLQAEINLVQTYPLMLRSRERMAVALMVDNIELASETLTAKGLRILTEDELAELV